MVYRRGIVPNYNGEFAAAGLAPRVAVMTEDIGKSRP